MSNTNLFAKTFKIADHQVLVTKEYDEDKKAYGLSLRTHYYGESIEVFYPWESDEERRDKAFSDFNELTARSFLILVNEMENRIDKLALAADRNQNQ